MSSISQLRFPEDWPAVLAVLSAAPDAYDWAAAFHVCLQTRIEKRYRDPIRLLDAAGPWKGEGFTIVTIQCALLEFLAALERGWNYRVSAPWGVNHQYSQTKDLYVEFMWRRAPFSRVVTTEAQALTFYKDIRCALVHEAQTKNGWKIRAGDRSSLAIDFTRLIVNRNKLQNLIDTYIADYGLSLTTTPALQQAFIRKFSYIHSHT